MEQRAQALRPMDPGRLNRRVTLQRKVETGRDEYNAPEFAWQTVATVWASVEPVSGREFWAQQQVQSDATIRIYIRHRAGITADMRAVMGSRVFSMVAPPIDWRDGHEYLQLMCSEGVLDA